MEKEKKGLLVHDGEEGRKVMIRVRPTETFSSSGRKTIPWEGSFLSIRLSP